MKPAQQFYLISIQVLTYSSYRSIPPLFASQCVVLFVTCGFPLTSNFFIWSVTLAMTTVVLCMAITYMWAMVLETSDHIGNAFDDIE
jgi:ABC-type spermidine/putrescine transport system permease subunit I